MAGEAGSCNPTLGQLDPNAPEGGTWIYNGYLSVGDPDTDPFNDSPQNPLFPGASSGSILPYSDSHILNVDGVSGGFYSLTHQYSPTSSSTIIIQILEALDPTECVGDDVEESIVAGSSGTINLFDKLDDVNCTVPVIGQYWLDDHGAGTAFDPLTGILTTDSLAEGTYIFTYKLAHPDFNISDCSTCKDRIFKYTLNVT